MDFIVLYFYHLHKTLSSEVSLFQPLRARCGSPCNRVSFPPKQKTLLSVPKMQSLWSKMPLHQPVLQCLCLCQVAVSCGGALVSRDAGVWWEKVASGLHNPGNMGQATSSPQKQHNVPGEAGDSLQRRKAQSSTELHRAPEPQSSRV